MDLNFLLLWQLYQRDLENLQGTVDRLQQEIRTLQTSSQIDLQDAERELREMYSWSVSPKGHWNELDKVEWPLESLIKSENAVDKLFKPAQCMCV